MSSIGQIHRNEYELEDDRKIAVIIAEAPGRIHFLGEQHEPHEGFFLSAAIDRYIKVAVNIRNDNSFRFYASDLGERKRGTLANLKFRREDRWANYLKTAIFLFLNLGYPVKGLNWTICGNIPQNIGLASSTAIETAAAVALKSLFRIHISDIDLIKKLTEAHSALFGQSVPSVDYQICLLARKDQFLVLDSYSEEIKKIKSPLSRFNILLVDSRVPRIGAENELISRRSDSLKGLELLLQKREGSGFRDLASADLLEALGDFPEQIRRRSLHIVEEIRRVNDAVFALERSDLSSLAKIIYHSHESLRDLYEVSCPEVDWLIKRAQEIEGTAGSRMTGLGFGGCTYVIIRRELAEEYKRRMEEYERIFGFRPVLYDVRLATGARIISERSKPKAAGTERPAKVSRERPASRRVNANIAHK